MTNCLIVGRGTSRGQRTDDGRRPPMASRSGGSVRPSGGRPRGAGRMTIICCCLSANASLSLVFFLRCGLGC